jgi:hypothetical protein
MISSHFVANFRHSYPLGICVTRPEDYLTLFQHRVLRVFTCSRLGLIELAERIPFPTQCISSLAVLIHKISYRQHVHIYYSPLQVVNIFPITQ